MNMNYCVVFGLLAILAAEGYCEIVYACDPSGAASVCKNQCDLTVEGEVPSNVCAGNKCCAMLCNGPSTFCYEEGWTCANKGCTPTAAQVQCPDNGVCCQAPPVPANWPSYPWPPYFGWPKDYVFPADYPFPTYWPNDWVPCPPSAYPDGVEPIDPAPTPETTPLPPPTPPAPEAESDEDDDDDDSLETTTTTTTTTPPPPPPPPVTDAPNEEPEPELETTTPAPFTPDVSEPAPTTEEPISPVNETDATFTTASPILDTPIVKKKKKSKKMKKSKALKKRKSKKQKKNTMA